jgi:hypothetical protein
MATRLPHEARVRFDTTGQVTQIMVDATILATIGGIERRIPARYIRDYGNLGPAEQLFVDDFATKIINKLNADEPL